MAIFLDTRGQSSLTVALCARCSRKFPIGMLKPDRNSPGLMVCDADNDAFDPYRLPARGPDRLNAPFVRPDISLVGLPGTDLGVYPYDTQPRVTQDQVRRVTEDGEQRVTQGPAP